VHESEADIELADGRETTVSCAVAPDVSVGAYVLVDRGFIIQTISGEEARTIVEMYAELSALPAQP